MEIFHGVWSIFCLPSHAPKVVSIQFTSVSVLFKTLKVQHVLKSSLEKMKKIAKITCFLTLILLGEPKQIPCENNKTYSFNSIAGYKTCFMNVTTRIDSTGFIISPQEDQNTKALIFQGNKKVFFLPENVHENFPDLLEIDGSECSIKAVSKESFKKLRKLKKLNLKSNEIEKITKSSFEDLTSLEILDLRNNNIKLMNGQAFNGLANLKKVGLNFNKCIKQDFDQSQVTVIPKIVKNSCGFCELNKPIEVKICEISMQVQKIAGKNLEEILNGQKRQLKMFENLRLTLNSEVPAKTSQATRIARLEAELTACIDAKDQTEKQFSLIKEFADKLDAQRVQTCHEKTQEMRKTINLNNQEKEKLQQELKKKTAELSKMHKMIESQ